jgi:hypothetical protein
MPNSAPAVLAATGLEAAAVRRHAHGATVIETGVALVKLPAGARYGSAISCGLAGALREGLPTASVVIPEWVGTTSGESIPCDPALTARLRATARELGYSVVEDPILTSSGLVVGEDRAQWARRGFAAVDMESARIPANAIAVVRVILDTPLRELSPEWINPMRAFMNPKNWRQGMWLAHEGPRCAEIAAKVVGSALRA